jgi:hypothetical protein
MTSGGKWNEWSIHWGYHQISPNWVIAWRRPEFIVETRKKCRPN